MSKLTIVMPTFNGGAYLQPQIDSILAQSDPDFELLVLDDGSRDDTVRIVDETARRDARVRRLPSTGNRGQRLRLIELLEAARTEFVAVADQDDVWHPDRNRRLLAAIGDQAVAFGRSQLIDGEGRDLGRTVLEAVRVDPMRAGPLSSLFWPLVSAHGAVIRRDWFDMGAMYHAPPFDHVFGLQAMLSSGLAYVDDAIVFHRIHGGNQMNGRVADGRGRAISRHRLRINTNFVRSGRLYFFQMLELLSRSGNLPAATRADFAAATAACRYAWFQLLDFRLSRAGDLARALHRSLDCYARSDADLAFFRRRVQSLVRPQFAPVNIAEGARRYLYGER